MAKTKIEKQATENTDGGKQMILKVDSMAHRWIKTIAEETEITQPNIVSLILGDAIKNDPAEYISRIKKSNAKNELQKLEEEIKQKESEKKRLLELLKV